MKRRDAMVLASLMLATAAAAPAQVNLLPSTTWGFAPIVSGWHFTTPLATSAGKVQDVAQAAVPLQLRVDAGRWTFDVTGAYAAGAVHTVSAGSDSSDDLVLLAG